VAEAVLPAKLHQHLGPGDAIDPTVVGDLHGPGALGAGAAAFALVVAGAYMEAMSHPDAAGRQVGRLPPCPDCGGSQIAGAVIEGEWLRRPVIALRLPRHITRLNTFVCVGCGRVQLYAADPGEFGRYAQRHPKYFRW